MKRRFLALLAAVCLAAVLTAGPASAYVDANGRITLITQHETRFKRLSVSGTSYTVFQAGCGLFSFAHAMQWLSGIRVTGEDDFALMKQLTELRLNPVSDMNYALLRLVHYDPTLEYHQGALTRKLIRDNTDAENEALFTSIFDSGGVVIANPYGHYVLAVGYRYADGQLYFQMIDSAGDATIRPRVGQELHIGYAFDTLEPITTGNTRAMQYWLPAECFYGKCLHDRYFCNWWWISGTSTLMEAYANPVGSPDFSLPEGLRTVEEEAFAGAAAKRVKLPPTVQSIRARAFADCPNLKGIYIPPSCSDIAPDAFSGCAGLTVYGSAGSYAETYAGEHGFDFAAADGG